MDELLESDRDTVERINKDLHERMLTVAACYYDDAINLINSLNIQIADVVGDGDDFEIFFYTADDRQSVYDILSTFISECEPEGYNGEHHGETGDETVECLRDVIVDLSNEVEVLRERVEVLESYLDISSIKAICSFVQELATQMDKEGLIDAEVVNKHLFLQQH